MYKNKAKDVNFLTYSKTTFARCLIELCLPLVTVVTVNSQYPWSSSWAGATLTPHMVLGGLTPFLPSLYIRICSMDTMTMDSQDGLKTIALPLLLNIFLYFLPAAALCHDFLLVKTQDAKTNSL